jgi:hypothetical protein
MSKKHKKEHPKPETKAAPKVEVSTQQPAKKPCTCRAELHGGNHYGWCESLAPTVIETPKTESKVKKPCSCRSELHGGNHYDWCDSFAK